MGFLDRLLGRRPLDTLALLDHLTRATAAEVPWRFYELCREHQDQIAERFDGWMSIPLELKSDPEGAAQRARMVVAIANFFDEKLGRPELRERLEANHPLAAYRDRLVEARGQMEALRYEEAAVALQGLLDELQAKDKEVDTAALRALTLGSLGEARFQLGRAAKSLEATMQALEICETRGDVEGVHTYLGNLYDVHRYRGDGAAAADVATQLAEGHDATDEPEQAARFRAAAAVAREGAPLLRLVWELDGEQHELSDIEGFPDDGEEALVPVRNRATLRPCSVLTERGSDLADSDQHAEALALFDQAAALDPFDPDCRYQAGLSLLLLKRYSEAVERYDEVERLAPGWFRVRAERWLAAALRDGKADHSALLAILALDDDEHLSPDTAVQVATAALRASPGLGWMHLLVARALFADDQEEAADAACKKGLKLAREPEIRSLLLLELAVREEDPAAQRPLLEQILELEGSLTAVATARLMLRAGA